MTELWANLPDSAPTPELLISVKQQRRLLAIAVTNLARQEQMLLILQYVEGKSSAETAAMLNTPPATIRGRTHAARRKLAMRLLTMPLPSRTM